MLAVEDLQLAMSEKEHARHLLDRLEPGQLSAVVRLLETLVPDDEGDARSDAERDAVAEADEWLKHHPPIPNEEVLADFGLTAADWEAMAREPEPRRG